MWFRVNVGSGRPHQFREFDDEEAAQKYAAGLAAGHMAELVRKGHKVAAEDVPVSVEAITEQSPKAIQAAVVAHESGGDDTPREPSAPRRRRE